MFWECILSPQKLDDYGQVFTDKGASPGLELPEKRTADILFHLHW
jgi:hypothetical protein